MKLFGKLRSFIGWEAHHSAEGIRISQKRYTEDLLRKYGIDKANEVRTPLSKLDNIEPKQSFEKILTAEDHSRYRSAIGELIYLAICPRLDISFAVGVLARQLHAPTQRHVGILRKLLRFLR